MTTTEPRPLRDRLADDLEALLPTYHDDRATAEYVANGLLATITEHYTNPVVVQCGVRTMRDVMRRMPDHAMTTGEVAAMLDGLLGDTQDDYTLASGG